MSDDLRKRVVESIYGNQEVPEDATLRDLSIYDWLDKIETAMKLENEFGIDIPDEEVSHWATLSDVVGSIRKGLSANEHNSG